MVFKKVFVIPSKTATVINPTTGHRIPEGGATVDLDKFMSRRIRDKDLICGKAPALPKPDKKEIKK